MDRAEAGMMPPAAPAPGPDAVIALDDGPVLGRGFGHGKVILLGEHAVVYDQPALAAGLSLGIHAEVKAGTGRLTAPVSSQLDARAGDGSAMGQALAAILESLQAGERLQAGDVDVRLEGELPPRAGLGSSAAVSIAIARAVAQARGCSAEAAQAAASDAEVIFHGTPSGIDLAAASSGGVGRFQRGRGWQTIPVLQSMTLCVGLSGKPRDTRAQVESVRRLRERTPAVDGVITTLGALVVAGEHALKVGDIDELGRLFDVAHGLLSALRVSSAELDALVHAARSAGAVGAKLTGAGGGGAVIALAPGHERDVLGRWRAAGFSGFVTQIGPAAVAAVAAAAAVAAVSRTARAVP
jgi:mevalonate kinase